LWKIAGIIVIALSIRKLFLMRVEKLLGESELTQKADAKVLMDRDW